MTPRFDNSRELGGADPLDYQVGPRRAALPLAPLDILLRRRAALGMVPATPPAVLFVPLGFALGPLGAGLIANNALAHLDTAVSIGLATLGVFIGMGLPPESREDMRLLGASCLQALVALVAVAGATWFLVSRWALPIDLTVPVLAVTLGICGASSSAGAPEASEDPVHRTASRIANLDDLVTIVCGGALLAALREGTVAGSVRLGAVTVVAGLGLALAGWLLFERARSDTERGVYVLGTLAALGGSAAYLSLSPLLAGLVAGLFWRLAPGRADEIIQADLRRIQHPLVVLVLLTAGAVAGVSFVAVWLFAPFVIFRFAGKQVGGWLASRLVQGIAPSNLSAYLVAPGLLGIAFALNLHQVVGSQTTAAILAATAAGSLASEVLALFALPQRAG